MQNLCKRCDKTKPISTQSGFVHIHSKSINLSNSLANKNIKNPIFLQCMHSAKLAANLKFSILKKRRRNKKKKTKCNWNVYSGDLFLFYKTRNILDFLRLIIGFLGINEKLFYMNNVKLLGLQIIEMQKSSIITLSDFM